MAVVASKLADAKNLPFHDHATLRIVRECPSERIVFVVHFSLLSCDQIRMVLSSPHLQCDRILVLYLILSIETKQSTHVAMAVFSGFHAALHTRPL